MQQESTRIVPLTQLGMLHFAGKDAKSFLQGQVTCNLNDISLAKAALGAHCNLQGRMQCLFRIHALDPHQIEFGLILPQGMLETAQQNFKKYALFSQVQIAVRTTHQGIGIYGPDAVNHLQKIDVQQLDNPYDCVSKETQNGIYTIVRLSGALPRFEIWGDVSMIKPLWENLTSDYDAVAPSAWELLDIRAGIPAIYPQTANQILPHHANLAILNGISFNKGCYLGQEIIARMQFRGKIKKHLYHACVPNHINVAPGMPIVSEKTVGQEAAGTVLQAAENEAGNFELLVVLDDNFSNFDNLRLNDVEGPKLEPLDLPYHF